MTDPVDNDPTVEALAQMLARMLAPLMTRMDCGFVLVVTRRISDAARDSAAVTNLEPSSARATLVTAMEALDARENWRVETLQ